jgi:tetratricopeptide (TPR) repeat protein
VAAPGADSERGTRNAGRGWRAGWVAAWLLAAGAALAPRLWNALAGPRLWGYDAWGHVSYALYLELYRALPWADQGWSYFHPPLHYALGALLVRSGDADTVARGLALLGSAASLGIAALAAGLARAAFAARAEASLVAFTAAALLPVQLYVSSMPGNKLTETFLSSAAIALFVSGERGPRARARRDLAVGALLGLALLAAASGLLALLAVLAALPFLRSAERPHPALAWRALCIAGAALAIAAPWYARNALEFGVLLRKSSDVAEVKAAERAQGPGKRGFGDALRFPLQLFADPDPAGPALLHSIPGTLYAGWWSDLYRESLIADPALRARERAWRSRLLLLGLAPTLLALYGALLFARDARAGRRRATAIPLALLLGANLAAYGLHAYWLPTWAALKAVYCAGATLPVALCCARGALACLGARPVAKLRAAGVATVLGVPGLTAAAVASEGALLDWRGDAPAFAALQFQLGELEAAGAYYGRFAELAPSPRPWLENLAAVELARGHAERALRLSQRAAELAAREGPDALREGRVAVAAALAGDAAQAEARFGRGLAIARAPELLANRGALRAAQGRAREALADLEAALALEPELCTAHTTRARVLSRAPVLGDAELALRAESACRCRAPRHYPYGVGSGEILEWGIGRRPLLLAIDSGLALAPRDFFRRPNCAGGGERK